MMVAIPDNVCAATLRAIDYLIVAEPQTLTDSASKALVPHGRDEEAAIMVTALSLVCQQLIAKLADGYGMDGDRLLRQVAGEITFQHRRWTRRSGNNTETEPVLRLPPQQGCDLWVVKM